MADEPDSPTSVITGHDLRIARQLRRLSQPELAAILKVSSKTLGRWERGDTSKISTWAIPSVEAFLGLRDQPSGPTLTGATDEEFMIELARRLQRRAVNG